MHHTKEVWRALFGSARVGEKLDRMSDTPTSVTPLEGKTTIDDKMFFEPERLSYQCADAIAGEIAQRVKNEVSEKTVVIASTQLLADFANLQAVYVMLDSLTRDYQSVAHLGRELTQRRSQPGLESLNLASESVIAAAVTGAIAPATAMVNMALGLVSFFREDVEYHGAKTVVDSLAFELAIASHLREVGAPKVIIPDLRIDSAVRTNENSLSFRLAKTQNAKSEAWRLVAPMITELVQLEAELERAAQEKNQAEFDRISAVVSDLRRDMQPVSEPLARCDQRLANAQEQWSLSDESTGVSELARLLRAEAIQHSNPTYLHAKVVSSGGHHRISRSLLRTIFVGDGLSFAGGATARWALLEGSGIVVKGGILVKRANASFQSWPA